MHHIRITVPERSKRGQPQIVTKDVVEAVNDDGETLDISAAVSGYEVEAHVGNVRLLTLKLICWELIDGERIESEGLDEAEA